MAPLSVRLTVLSGEPEVPAGEAGGASVYPAACCVPSAGQGEPAATLTGDRPTMAAPILCVPMSMHTK